MSKDLSSRVLILSAAEAVFASKGFTGASMREIALNAGISQALLHYHFKSKENLYEEIFARKARIINGYRSQLIDEIFAGESIPRLEDLLTILFSPASDALGVPGLSSSFTQMVSRIVSSDDQLSRDLMIKHYDPIARKFIAAFLKLSDPPLSEVEAVWAYLFAHSARLQIYAHTGRPERLTGKPMTETRRRMATEGAIAFTAAGIRAMTRS